MAQIDYSNFSGAAQPSHADTRVPEGSRFAFVEASWHSDIVRQARKAFILEMGRYGVAADAIDLFVVPGAFEIPLHLRKLMLGRSYAAVVACALVVDGGIYRHEFVAQSVVGALMTLQLESGTPVISAVLTPHHFHEHLEHRKYFQQHFSVKGTEAARACVQTVQSLHRIETASRQRQFVDTGSIPA